jgi:hypothetical protein
LSRFRDVTKLCQSREIEHKKALDFIECFFAFLKGDAGTESGMTIRIRCTTSLCNARRFANADMQACLRSQILEAFVALRRSAKGTPRSWQIVQAHLPRRSAKSLFSGS